MATRAILFDVDGTLVDTRSASWELFAETSRAFALGIDTREAWFKVFEGNFYESFARLVPDAAHASAALAHFMEAMRTRYHPAMIPGMADAVRALAPRCTLAVISSNGTQTIRRILEGAGIATCFSHVFAGDVEPRKVVSIRRFLVEPHYAVSRGGAPDERAAAPAATPFAPDEVVMVTDTAGDIAEAREAGIRALGVAWGMHGEGQLLEAGAERVARRPAEIVDWL